MEAQIDFSTVFFRCFFRTRFGIDFGWIFGTSERDKSTKTIVFSMVFVNFHKIDVFKKSTKKVQIWIHFGMPKPLKIHKKSCLKLMLFSTPFF